MANKKKKSAPSSSPIRSLTFTAELYPEWSNYINILTYLKRYKYAFIHHDKDVKEDTGEIKKLHAHVVIKYGGRRTLTSVKTELKALGIPDNLVNTCNERAMLRYLLHLDNPEKHQYSKDEVKTNMPNECQSAWNDEISAEEGFRLLLDFIEQSERKISYIEMDRYAITHGLTKALSRYGTHINGARNEHNREFEYQVHEEMLKDKVKMEQSEKNKWIHNYQVSAEENMRLRGIDIDEKKEDVWEGIDEYKEK